MSVGLAIIRVVLGLYLTTHGLQKASSRLGFGGISGTAEGFARAGMRGGRFPAVLTAVLQLGAGILLAIGLLTPLAAMAAAGVMIVATQTRLLGTARRVRVPRSAGHHQPGVHLVRRRPLLSRCRDPSARPGLAHRPRRDPHHHGRRHGDDLSPARPPSPDEGHETARGL
jgi:hypothetical protein